MRTILVLNPHAGLRLALRATLEPLGARVVDAADAAHALAALDIETPQLLIMGDAPLGMPAAELIPRIKEMRPLLPIIVLSPVPDAEERSRFLRMGAMAYLPVPFENRELVSAVQKWIAQAPASAGAPPILDSRPDADIESEEDMRPRSRSWVVTAVLLVFACASAAWTLTQWRQLQLRHDYISPATHPTDMSWVNGRLWLLDWLDQKIFVLQPGRSRLALVRTYQLPAGHVSGMAVSDSYVYTSDNWHRKIRVHRRDDALTVIAEYPSPGPSPANLFWDGRYLWSVDPQARRVFQLDVRQKLAPVASYPTPGPAPAGFYKDDKFIWTLDARTRRLYRHRIDAAMTVLGVYKLPEFDEGSEPLACFSWNGPTLWYARDRKSILSRRDQILLKIR